MTLSAAAHAVFLLAAARAVPSLDEDRVDADTRTTSGLVLIQPYLGSTAEREEDDPPAPTPAESTPDGREHADSRCGEQRGGSMGSPDARHSDLHYGVQGPADNPDPHIASHPAELAFDHSFTFPWAPTALPAWGGDPGALMMPWGRDDSLGNDPRSALGNMWGNALGMSLGSPGAGIGLRRPCPTCGDYGEGAWSVLDPSGTSAGGATGTERAGGDRLSEH